MTAVSKWLFIIIVILLYSFCSKAQGRQPLPGFSYNGKSYNRLIVERVPEYGLTARDGCVVHSEINLALRDKDAQIAEGVVRDAATGDTLQMATIKLKRRNGLSETLRADVHGQFLIDKSSPVKELQVMYIGYRTLTVKHISRNLF